MKDVAGNEISVGQRVAHAMRVGNTARVRLGEVVEIIDIIGWSDRSYEALKVRWDDNGKVSPRLVEILKGRTNDRVAVIPSPAPFAGAGTDVTAT